MPSPEFAPAPLSSEPAPAPSPASADEQHLKSLRQDVATNERLFGADDAETWVAKTSLAKGLAQAGQLDQALPLALAAAAGLEKKLGPQHAETFVADSLCAQLLTERRRYAEAELFYASCQAGLEKAFGKESDEVDEVVAQRAANLSLAQNHAEAAPLYRRLVERRGRALGPEHRETLQLTMSLANALLQTGQLAEAEPLFQRVLKSPLPAQEADGRWLITVLSSLGEIAEKQEKPDAAEGYYRRAIERAEKTVGPHDTFARYALLRLAIVLQKTHRTTKALTATRQLLASYQRHPAPDDPQFAAAEKLLKELLEE